MIEDLNMKAERVMDLTAAAIYDRIAEQKIVDYESLLLIADLVEEANVRKRRIASLFEEASNLGLDKIWHFEQSKRLEGKPLPAEIKERLDNVTKQIG